MPKVEPLPNVAGCSLWTSETKLSIKFTSKVTTVEILASKHLFKGV